MEKIKSYFLENIGEKRWEHSLRVLDTALKLGENYGGNREKIVTASLLHDCAKIRDSSILLKKAKAFDIILDDTMIFNKELIHGPLGAKIAEKEFHIKDKDILNAISYHTTGRASMTTLEKIIFIADIIEPERNFPGVKDIRKLAFESIDRAIVLSMDLTIEFLIKNKQLISLDTIEARNHIKIEIKKGEEATNGRIK